MKEWFGKQFENRFLWSPFVMAAGAAFYFLMPFEPGIPFAFIFAIFSGAMIFVFRRNYFLSLFFCLLFGFFYTFAFTHWLATPQIKHSIRNVNITGVVSNTDYTNKNARIFLKTDIGTVRVSYNETPPKTGDTINATVSLYKPSGPSAPETFDYSRWAYFNGITATGYMTDYSVIKHTKYAGLNSLRDYIHTKTNSFLSDTLVLGYKNAVPRDDTPIWTATGVGHVWSISGFHMTLVSVWLFGFFYLIFRAIAPLTRRYPARYPATICAWSGLFFYLFLSGLDVATTRAFIMASLAFGAILLGRNALSLRFVCLAFILIFLINPHYVMQPGFQLSFAAIFGLIWYFGDRQYKKLSVPGRVFRAIGIAAMTSVIATIFTAPFVAAHFYSFPIYGLIGNLILLPVFSFVIMTLVFVGTITALFEIHFPLIWSHNVYDWTLNIAHKISELPFATIQTPHIPTIALGFMIFGLLCLIFIKRFNYILCATFVTIGIAITIFAPRPLFYATPDHELVGFNIDGKLQFSKARASNHYFAFNAWRKLNYEKPADKNIRKKPFKGVWTYKTKNWNLAYIQKFVPLSKNLTNYCNSADFIVSYFDIDSKNCSAKFPIGGFVIYENGDIKYTQRNRLWMN